MLNRQVPPRQEPLVVKADRTSRHWFGQVSPKAQSFHAQPADVQRELGPPVLGRGRPAGRVGVDAAYVEYRVGLHHPDQEHLPEELLSVFE